MTMNYKKAGCRGKVRKYAEGGLVEPGNIDLDKRPVVHNKDGSISTERSMSSEEGGLEVLYPRVYGKSVLSEEDAGRLYRMSGKHLGKFATPKDADEYAEKLHQRQEKKYGR